MLFIAVGTGVGGALVLGGQLRRGHSSTAGEVGTLLVDVSRARADSAVLAGRLESYASGPAIAERYCDLAQTIRLLDLRAVAERARQGDALAQAAVAEGAMILGLALNGLLNTLDPEALIIGGGVPMLGDLWWKPFVNTIRSNPMPGPSCIAIRAAELLTHAPIAGAGALAFDHLA